MEQIKVFRAITIEEVERNVNHWLEDNQDKQMLDITPPVYEPPRPSSGVVVPDQEAWLVLVRFEAQA